MTEIHVNHENVVDLRALLASIPFSDRVHLNLTDVVDAGSLLLYLGLLKNALQDAVKDINHDRFELGQYRTMVDNLRHAQQIINRKPTEEPS